MFRKIYFIFYLKHRPDSPRKRTPADHKGPDIHAERASGGGHADLS